MRILRVLPFLFTIVLIWLLNHSFGTAVPAIGRLLDPVNGAVTAAEDVHKDFNQKLQLKDLQAPVSIWLEDRLVPHIRAANDHDLYYAQGYIHAYFRLWQMDLQTRAAGGRVSEVVGPKALEYDRGQRRKGMVFAAEHSLQAIEANPTSKLMLDAYTAGINAYIASLSYRDLPLEYKLMGFAPEQWTNLRSTLLMKYMADDLTGKTDDIAFTILRDQLGQEQFDFLFPEKIKGSKPVIPEGTSFPKASLPQPAYPGDSVWAHFNHAEGTQSSAIDPSSESGIGSNNWAISGKHTASGKPILCNDPHLALNLPSLWFEMQLTAPGINVYGASLPGAPGIVIGFNDKLAWGFTNNYRDVKDYYDITVLDKDHYLFNHQPTAFEKRIERIAVRGRADVLDTVSYTIQGPIQYDPSYPDPAKSGRHLAMCWMAHRGTNELLSIYMLNRAGDYNAFTTAIQHFECPAQNFAYADKAGNIAMWGQGRFINKWQGQGKYVMEGKDSLTLWGQDIPMEENPHVLNPPQGYVASANQSVTDSTYPYWYNGDFTEWRSWEINRMLSSDANNNKDTNKAQAFTAVDAMKDLQNDVSSHLDFLQEKFCYGALLIPGAGLLEYNSETATTTRIFWSQLYKDIWQDDFTQPASRYPSTERTVQLLLSDSTSTYYDDKRTQQIETLRDIVQRAFKETTDSLAILKRTTGLEWYKVKNTSLTHLAKIPAFSYDHLKVGGWNNTINANTHDHGPSWRMIVEMDDSIHAYAIYPGGQSGNPGSPHYGDFIDQWVTGQYNTLRFIPTTTTTNPFKYTWTLTP